MIVIQGDQDGLVRGARRWVDKMKELKMDYEYLEIKGGGHVDVAYKHFPELFDFFNAHTRDGTAVASKPAPKKTTGSQVAERFEGFKKTPVTMDYLAHLPKGYQEGEKKWPLILFLHGAGSVGDNLDRIKRNGLPQLLDAEADSKIRPYLDRFIIISPQSTERRWSSSSLEALLFHVEKKYKVDQQRVYLTGLSMGGYGTWSMAGRFPRLLRRDRPYLRWWQSLRS